MNLFHLRYFETLARTEHYSKAAEILSITQPSLSYAISTLESELGIQLFEKRGRNIVLTKYGKAFYSNVKEILANLDNAVRDIKLVANGEGEINIGFLRTLGTDYVPTTVKNHVVFSVYKTADQIDREPMFTTEIKPDIFIWMKIKKVFYGSWNIVCSECTEKADIDFTFTVCH